MKNTIKGLGWDTAVVVFLLALECGRAVQFLSIEALLMGIAIVMLLALPYFLQPIVEITFGKWLAGRAIVALGGIGLGTILPVSMQFMPMTLLIAAALVSCYLQFYGLMRLRLAK